MSTSATTALPPTQVVFVTPVDAPPVGYVAGRQRQVSIGQRGRTCGTFSETRRRLVRCTSVKMVAGPNLYLA